MLTKHEMGVSLCTHHVHSQKACRDLKPDIVQLQTDASATRGSSEFRLVRLRSSLGRCETVEEDWAKKAAHTNSSKHKAQGLRAVS